MKFILGKKIEMGQLFRGDRVMPVTIVKAGKCRITQIRTKDKDGYQAVQLGFETKKKLRKPEKGHLKNLENFTQHLFEKGAGFRYLREFRIKDGTSEALKVGDQISVGVFAAGDKVKATGISRGKGFQGVVKRHGFHGSPKTHGHKDQLRMPGSIGATEPARVFKGMRMAGRMGGEQVTVKNLEIVEIDEKNDLLKIKGAIPGSRGSLLLISSEGVMEIKKTEEKATP
ncbi:MAG: 50S ribosomal protein L3 [bacterium]